MKNIEPTIPYTANRGIAPVILNSFVVTDEVYEGIDPKLFEE